MGLGLHLKGEYGLEPIHLFASEAHAPQSEAFLPIKSISICETEDEDVLTFIQILGGTLPELLPNEDIRKPLIHTFREDLRVLQTYSFEKAERNIFSSDITCFNGSEDKPLIFSAWHDLTSGAISFYRLPGDHFYLLEPSNEIFLTKHITRCIENAGL
ncbi:S-acyl fatty acid synthase thioesterase, medium chain [Accipiter gentilis]|uniref:S-acyl fatty acid synthase thioesterase, medium chain n=1 Tax=Astur gentilis TaxID=8957 RepID=UPI00210FAA9A|nr:S-acyl fatty acid synthase thioesterase, medium chain [Accipiter gentilis]